MHLLGSKLIMERVPVFIMRGLPGSGKTTFAKRLQMVFEDIGYNVVYISRDELRESYAKFRGITYEETFVKHESEIWEKWWRLCEIAFNCKTPRKAIIVDTQFITQRDIMFILNYMCGIEPNNHYESYDDWAKAHEYRVRVVEFPEVIDNHRNVAQNKIKEFKKAFNDNRYLIERLIGEKNIIRVK